MGKRLETLKSLVGANYFKQKNIRRELGTLGKSQAEKLRELKDIAKRHEHLHGSKWLGNPNLGRRAKKWANGENKRLLERSDNAEFVLNDLKKRIQETKSGYKGKKYIKSQKNRLIGSSILGASGLGGAHHLLAHPRKKQENYDIT